MEKWYWCTDWLQYRDRFSHINLIRQLQFISQNNMRNYLRTWNGTFQKLLFRDWPKRAGYERYSACVSQHMPTSGFMNSTHDQFYIIKQLFSFKNI